jgi:hypothetical protein
VKRRTSSNTSALGISSHSLFRRISVRSRSSTLNACSWYVRALSVICSSVSTGRVSSRPLGSPTRAV